MELIMSSFLRPGTLAVAPVLVRIVPTAIIVCIIFSNIVKSIWLKKQMEE